MPRMKRTENELLWLDSLDRAFPTKGSLTLEEVSNYLGYGRTATKKWVTEYNIPQLVMSVPTAKQERVVYPKEALAKVLAANTLQKL